MKKKTTFKPTCAWIKKEQANAKRAFRAWYSLGSGAVGAAASMTSSLGYCPAAKKVKQKADDLVLYAAALGQKQGKLPVDLTDWGGKPSWSGDNGSVTFTKLGRDEPYNPIEIPVRFLEWSPAPPAEETMSEIAARAADQYANWPQRVAA